MLSIRLVHRDDHAISEIATVDENSRVAEGHLVLAEDCVAHPDDFLKSKGVHPKRGSRVVPAQKCPLQRSVGVGLVQLNQWM
eukprot:2076469-Rhodomonas_salina.1